MSVNSSEHMDGAHTLEQGLEIETNEGPDNTELVERRVFGVKVVCWVPKGTRNEFIKKERTRIAEEFARQIESDDPDNTSD